jgi:predicted ATPase/class 3 adenylate cyclase
MIELPSGTLTFLFTDVEASTRLWEEHPDAMRGALARHDEVLREAIAARGGQIVKTTGDGVHAVFATATDAVGAAVDAQHVLVDESWDETGPLRVRMGLHTCQAEYRDGDYYGTGVNRAARLMSAAHGGQILVSQVTEQVVRDVPEDAVTLVDLGEHRLRDLNRAERVFQVVVAGLPAAFEPVRTLDAFPGNLPLQVTSFVGREDDVAALAKALEAARLLTLTGVGGVGKTRLAMQVAAEVIPRFPDGAWFCELATADDPDAMLQVIAATLGVQPRQGITLEQSIVESLRPKRVLLLLDNCEHLLREAARLASSVLRECRTAHVLTTSREALAVAGEQVWPVASLAIPDIDDGDIALRSESVRLFDDRAHAARPDFRLTASNSDAVIDICRRLDGIPLAIELAAARVAALSPSDISDLLDERFRLLTGSRQSSIERHQTLRATVDWSYSMLDEHERVIFDRFAVFTGSFDARAAQAVAAGEGIESWDVLDTLTSLVAKSMVTAEESADGSMRYQLLETLRQYGRERLDERDETDRWRRCHADFYATVADEIGAGLLGPDELTWRPRLAADLDNLRAAVTWSLDRVEQSDFAFALRIVAASVRINSDNAAVFGQAAERAAERVAGTARPLRTRVLAVASQSAALLRGDHETGRRFALQVLEDEEDDPYAAGMARGNLATVAFHDGDVDGAVRWATAGFPLSSSGPIEVGYFAIYPSAAIFAAVGGQIDLARKYAEEGLAYARELRNPSGLALMLWAWAFVFERDDPSRALDAFEESASLVRSGAHDVNYGATLAHIARLRDRQGDHAQALDALLEALQHFRRVGPRTEVVVVVSQASRSLAMIQHAEAAAVLAGVVTSGPIASLTAAGSPERIARGAAAAHAQLGDSAYQAAFARGAAMSYDETMAYARTELGTARAKLATPERPPGR